MTYHMEVIVRCEGCGTEKPGNLEGNRVDDFKSTFFTAFRDHICAVNRPSYTLQAGENVYRAEHDAKDVSNLLIRLL